MITPIAKCDKHALSSQSVVSLTTPPKLDPFSSRKQRHHPRGTSYPLPPSIIGYWKDEPALYVWIYARKMAAKAARAATAIELPTVLAAPLKVAMGEPVALGGMTLGFFR